MKIGDIVRMDPSNANHRFNGKNLTIVGYTKNDLGEEILLIDCELETSHSLHKSYVYVYKTLEQQRIEKLEKLNDKCR